MSRINWTREQITDYREDGSSWLGERNGERVGEIVSTMENAGSLMYPRWTVSSYDATPFCDDGEDREFLVSDYGSPASALAAAKRWIAQA